MRNQPPADKAIALIGNLDAWLRHARMMEEIAKLALRAHKRFIRRWSKDPQTFTEKLNNREVSDAGLDLIKAYYWLMSVCLELTMKAILLHDDPELIKKRDLAGHDLNKLSSRLGMFGNPLQQMHLEKLSRYNVWAGRYPVPLWKDFEPTWNAMLARNPKSIPAAELLTPIAVQRMQQEELTPERVEMIKRELIDALVGRLQASGTLKVSVKKQKRSGKTGPSLHSAKSRCP